MDVFLGALRLKSAQLAHGWLEDHGMEEVGRRPRPPLHAITPLGILLAATINQVGPAAVLVYMCTRVCHCVARDT